MNTVERVKLLCIERKTAISKLEKELGFANGYISQLRKGTFPDDRLRKIADYFNVSIEFLLFGEEQQKEKSPAPEGVELSDLEYILSRLPYMSKEDIAKLMAELPQIFMEK